MKNGKRMICDIDGVLCENERVHYHLKKPYWENIHLLEEFQRKGWRIILFTSRKSVYRKQTLWWLRRNRVPYNKLIMDKPKGDVYVDDKSVREMKKVKR